MRVYWSGERANGSPIEEGSACLVTDLEDGTHPIYTYGRDQAEVLEKVARQNAHAQLALARRAATPNAAGGGTAQVPGSSTPPAAPRRSISPDQVMQATQDLTNPAKAADAVATLLESATGIDPVQQARRHYATLALEWEHDTPAFLAHPGNRQLVGDLAIRMAGHKPGSVTREILDQAFTQLQADGLLFERSEEPPAPPSNPPNPQTTFPGENPVQRSERPRGTRFSTGASSLTFNAPQTVTTRALKFTEEQIRTMPEKERRRVFDDPDYIAACDFYFSGARA